MTRPSGPRRPPTTADNPIIQLDNVLVTLHMVAANRHAMLQKSLACYANVRSLATDILGEGMRRLFGVAPLVR